MKKFLGIFMFLVSSATLADEEIFLSPGHQKVLPAPGMIRTSIGNPKIANVKALPKSGQVIVTGLSPGSTNLILWFENQGKKSFSIHVQKTSASLEEIQSLLKGIEGVHLKKLGNRIAIEGQIFKGQDLERIQQVLQLYPSTVNLTHMNQEALQYFSQQIKTNFSQVGFEKLEVHPFKESILLEGEVFQEKDRQRAEQIAQSIFSSITNQLTVGIEPSPMVLMDVKIMEIRKDSLQDFGIQWPSQISAQGTATFSTHSSLASGTLTQNSGLSLVGLIEKRLAKVLANPKLLCKNSSPASFFAGGEIPIRLISERSANIFFKTYGISLDVTAKMDRSQHVSVEVTAKISNLDAATSVEGIPGILDSHITTTAILSVGETILLGGLLENQSGKNIKKFPFLGHIPILGELFKSRSFQQNESELVVLLSPQPIHAGDPSTHLDLKKSQQAFEKQNQEMKFSFLD